MVDKKRSSTRDGNNEPEIEMSPELKKEMYTTWGEMIRHWPKTTLCIVSNEFCERFSYYGMRTVLILYLLNVLKFNDSQSTVFFNGFTVLCYITPLLGSILADGYIGKFRTIFFVSILYACGQVILALASIKDKESKIHPWMDLAGLIIIGFGTGGIKPCVSAFGGDQFEIGQERMLSLFFSMFYFSINAGSMISTFISPIFRSQPCLGQDSCYPLAFGIPAILMVLATCLFMAGSFWYKKPPPKENVFGEVARVFGVGALQYSALNMMAYKRSKKFLDDVKSLLRVLIMFLPVPMFWALYDQQGSIWLIQGIQMDCRLFGNLLLLPDQMQTLNAVLILLFIPLFQIIIYPLIAKCFAITPLRKMVAGGLLASLSLAVAGFVQISVNIYFTCSLYRVVLATTPRYDGNLVMCRMDATDFDPAHPCNPRSPSDFYYWETNYDGGTDDRKANSTYMTAKGNSTDYAVEYVFKPVKPGKGFCPGALLYALKDFSSKLFFRWQLYYLDGTPKNVGSKTPPKTNITVKATGVWMEVHEQGAVYVLALTGSKDQPTKHINQVVEPNSVSILWQIPQIVIITVAEILFSITGYEFAYSQSAPSMKALVQALWLLTTAIGDSIIVLITALNLFSNMATEFFAYAGAMCAVIFVFALMAIFYYEYNFYTQEKNPAFQSEDGVGEPHEKAVKWNEKLDDRKYLVVIMEQYTLLK
ncbi:unnamed protein product [Angiostrongylus costaricensis]|uniref:Oligopeptide transporter 1 n=1 Tax=Angiostrongylus costaricensis TaxID=334426 RepID=A0A158PF88_ANGCS|nr:unnamed protein product [Angiostrongylus costaricensis]